MEEILDLKEPQIPLNKEKAPVFTRKGNRSTGNK